MRGSWDGCWTLVDITEYVNVDVFSTPLCKIGRCTEEGECKFKVAGTLKYSRPSTDDLLGVLKYSVF